MNAVGKLPVLFAFVSVVFGVQCFWLKGFSPARSISASIRERSFCTIRNIVLGPGDGAESWPRDPLLCRHKHK
jgi:hypothetical protein